MKHDIREAVHDYRCHGMTLRSSLALPELAMAPPGAAEPEIEIVIVARLETLADAEVRYGWLELAPRQALISIEGVARYRIVAGRRIEVALAEGVSPEAQAVRVYLLGSAMCLLLYQRGSLPLHVGAVQTPSGGWAFTGDSGAGKSTLAAWLYVQRGWPMIADDVAVLDEDDTPPLLHSGPARIKLWGDAMAWLGLPLEHSIADEVRPGKYHLPAAEAYAEAPVAMTALVVLAPGAPEATAPRLVPLQGIEAFQALGQCLYQPLLGDYYLGQQQLWQRLVALGARLRVYRLERPWGKARMEASLAPLLSEIEACAPPLEGDTRKEMKR